MKSTDRHYLFFHFSFGQRQEIAKGSHFVQKKKAISLKSIHLLIKTAEVTLGQIA